MDRETLEKKLAEKTGVRYRPERELLKWDFCDTDGEWLPTAVADSAALWSECLRLMAEREWVKVSPETMPEDHTSWLIAWHNYGTGNIVEEAYWNGEHWCLTRTNPCDESIYLDEQVYAYTKIPDAPGREIVLPTEGGKE